VLYNVDCQLAKTSAYANHAQLIQTTVSQ